MKYKEENFGKNLCEIRIRKGFTVLELSKKTNLSRTILYKYQNNQMFPNGKNLKNLAKVLDVPISQFFK